MTGQHHTHVTSDLVQDAELLALWVAGQCEGLDELAARHHRWMLRLVGQVSAGERDPEAVVQDAWCDVMRGAAGYRGEGSVRSWLATIVRRRVITTWRARDARPRTLTEYVPETRAPPRSPRTGSPRGVAWRGC